MAKHKLRKPKAPEKVYEFWTDPYKTWWTLKLKTHYRKRLIRGSSLVQARNRFAIGTGGKRIYKWNLVGFYKKPKNITTKRGFQW